MQIHLTARHCEIGPDLRAFAQSRLERLTKYDDGIQDIRVIVSQERKLHTVEITLRAHQHDVVITETHAEPGAAIEQAADRLEERVRRDKEKRVRSPRREGRGNGAAPAETGAATDDADEAFEDEV